MRDAKALRRGRACWEEGRRHQLHDWLVKLLWRGFIFINILGFIYGYYLGFKLYYGG